MEHFVLLADIIYTHWSKKTTSDSSLEKKKRNHLAIQLRVCWQKHI